MRFGDRYGTSEGIVRRRSRTRNRRTHKSRARPAPESYGRLKGARVFRCPPLARSRGTGANANHPALVMNGWDSICSVTPRPLRSSNTGRARRRDGFHSVGEPERLIGFRPLTAEWYACRSVLRTDDSLAERDRLVDSAETAERLSARPPSPENLGRRGQHTGLTVRPYRPDGRVAARSSAATTEDVRWPTADPGAISGRECPAARQSAVPPPPCRTAGGNEERRERSWFRRATSRQSDAPFAATRRAPPLEGVATYTPSVPAPPAQKIRSVLSGDQRSPPVSGALKISTGSAVEIARIITRRWGEPSDTKAKRRPSGEQSRGQLR